MMQRWARVRCAGGGGVVGGAVLMIALAALSGLQGCVPVIAGGAVAASGVTLAQERTVGQAVDDTAIQARIQAKLFEKEAGLLAKVNLEVVQGRVLMTGVVPTPEDRVEAGRLAWTAGGMKEIINEIQVSDQSKLTDFATDSWITTQIKSRLLFDKDIASVNYNVETVNGVVYVLGIAQDQAELNRVTNVARTTRYVKQVISHVRIKGT
ncbi:MAG: BON domain-containing protein [Alphaproteobacteria bacterium]|nr:BON domain-containing protein [Alphaproteobacteria bacterium]